jgi:hypothetical protein
MMERGKRENRALGKVDSLDELQEELIKGGKGTVGP